MSRMAALPQEPRVPGGRSGGRNSPPFVRSPRGPVEVVCEEDRFMSLSSGLGLPLTQEEQVALAAWCRSHGSDGNAPHTPKTGREVSTGSEAGTEEAYYSEPERDVMWSAPIRAARPASLSCDPCYMEGMLGAVAQPPPTPAQDAVHRGRSSGNAAESKEPRQRSSSSSTPLIQARRLHSEPQLLPTEAEKESSESRAKRMLGLFSLRPPSRRGGRCGGRCCRRYGWWSTSSVRPQGSTYTGYRSGLNGTGTPSFWSWLADEVHSRPDAAELARVPRSHLEEVARVPWQLEKLLLIGFLLCSDIVLHELSFTPLKALYALQKLLARGLQRQLAASPLSPSRSGPASRLLHLSVTEQGDIIRLTLLVLNTALILCLFDVSWTYHYIRGESFLKLYVIFNMLEMFERWGRSVGVDLFDLVMASVQKPWQSLLPKYVATLIYCFLHSASHLLRVLLLQVAINTSSSAVFLIIVTNNFAEIKSTVFKKYEPKSLFPIIASDIVERSYLLTDILFVLARLLISTHRGSYTASDIASWLFLLVFLELGTDWIKFCLIMKFSELPASTFEVYKEVLIADVLLCRVSRSMGPAHVLGLGTGSASTPAKDKDKTPNVPFRGIHSFSHSLQRRLGFSGVPMTTIIVVHFVMLARSPCSRALQWRGATMGLIVSASFAVCLLAKVLLSVVIFGFSARRRSRIPHGMELFPKIKSL